jgi:VWFA-related protein
MEFGRKFVEAMVMNGSFRTALFVLLAMPALAWGLQTAEPPRPVLIPHRAPQSDNPVSTPGRIKLDVVVTDKAGKPVTGLEAHDFTLLDSKVPRKILSFQAFDGITVKPDLPVEVILLFDFVNDDLANLYSERREVLAFLRENGGHLAQPTSIFVFRDTSLQSMRQPTSDGNLLADAVAKMKTSFRVNGYESGANGDMERYKESLHALSAIAEYEKKRPGRKLLFWIGPGWPLLNSLHFQPTLYTLKQNFKSIIEFSTMLREARVNVYSVGVGEYHVTAAHSEWDKQNAWTSGNPASFFNGMYDDANATTGSETDPGMASFVVMKDYYNPSDYLADLKGVKQYWRANAASLSVKVLATQNGGRVLGLNNGLASQIDSSIQDARAFYTISFNPSPAAHPNEYHDLKVLIESDGTKLTAHTSTGYYNQP